MHMKTKFRCIEGLLDWLLMQVKRLKKEGLRTRLKALIKKVLRKIDQRLVAHPQQRQRLIVWSHKLGLYSKLKTLQRKIEGGIGQAGLSAFGDSMSIAIENMSPRALQIYAELKEAIERHQKSEA